jgi:L-alanine-DL-glutamate epimerase-like enolase superfamily enzyme
MQIREIRAIGLRGETPEGGWSEELRPEDCVHTVLEVHTDEDLVGLGSVFTNDGLVRAALDVLAPLYRNENALEPERVSEKLRRTSFWIGRGGTITHTISGIDIALWDILGKATGQPVGRLLGGRYRERVRPYASVLADEPARLRDTLAPLVASGYRAFKVGWGPLGKHGAREDEAIVRAARDAVGTEAQLMVDAGASDTFWPHGYSWALRTAEMLADYHVAWFEEPLPPDALDDFVELRRRTSVPVAGGEVLTRRQSFTPFLSAGAFDIVQPDVTKVGGISESRRIAWMAEAHGARLIPHGWNTAVGVAADLQLASAFAHTDFIEYIAGSPYVDDLAAGGWTLDGDGMLPIPAGPGLGIELDPEALERFGRTG